MELSTQLISGFLVVLKLLRESVQNLDKHNMHWNSSWGMFQEIVNLPGIIAKDQFLSLYRVHSSSCKMVYNWFAVKQECTEGMQII